MRVIAFFNNKGGVGKTSLVYHLAHLFAQKGKRTLCADLDPQANLSSMFLDDARLENIYSSECGAVTIRGCVAPILEGTGDISKASIEESPLDPAIGLIVGDIGLTEFEDRLGDSWSRALDKDKAAVRAISAFARIIDSASRSWAADVALVDVGPNLGAINRAALIASDFVVVPLAPDLFSLRGLLNLGPTLAAWRDGWRKRLAENPSPGFELPRGDMRPIGYVVLQHAVRLDRPVKAYDRWMNRIPETYRESIESADAPSALLANTAQDPNCLALLKNYRSLMPLAQDARKPMFMLRQADGALGAQQSAVTSCYDDFDRLAQRILERVTGSAVTA